MLNLSYRSIIFFILILEAIMKYKKVNYGEKPNQIVIYRTSVEDKNEFAIYKLELNHIKVSK